MLHLSKTFNKTPQQAYLDHNMPLAG